MYTKSQINTVANILKKNETNYWTGKYVKKFEKEFSSYFGNKYSVAVSNGSVALEIAIRSLNLKKGDEVIVTPRSFVISASCVLNLDLKPIFADVDKNGNLNIHTIKKVFSNKVRAIIIVHLNGLPCDLDEILNFKKEKNIFLIEDCSQAHGAKYKKKFVGSFGDISAWSFCQDKIISTGGEGGMIATNNEKLWQSCWSFKDHGKNFNSCFHKKHKVGFKWLHDFYGSNYRMTEIQAAIGREQLKSLNQQIKKRNLIANLYLSELKDYYEKYSFFKKPNFKCVSCPFNKSKKKCNQCRHAFYRLNFFINKSKINQTKFLKEMEKKKISCGIGSCPEIYREKIFRKLDLAPKKRLVNAKLLGETSITFPINPNKHIFKIKKEINYIKIILNKYFTHV
jgi:dTDP-4-amino-4,6-dideoxygalactose transaminase